MRNAPRKILLLLIVLTSLACTLLNPTPVAWSLTPDPTGSPEVLPAVPRSQTTTSTPPAAPPVQITTPTLPLPSPTPANQTQGPGSTLLYSRADGETLVVVHPEQPPVEIALPAPLLVPSDLDGGVSPDGVWLAVRTGQPGGKAMALTLVDLNGGTAKTITPLLTPELEQVLLEAPGEPSEAVLAVQETEALAWSPDGQRLAFIAAADGSSSDLYLYDLATEKVRRLTRGSNQAATPLWSSDGQWIVHQEVQTFGTGAGWTVTAVWAASAGHDETRRLYTPPSDGGGERILGWTGPETLLTYTWTPAGSRQVREIPLHNRWLFPAYKGPFESAALDPASHTLAVVQSQVTGRRANLVPGLYRLKVYQQPPEPELVQVGEWSDVTWWQSPGTFVAAGLQGALTLDPDGGTSFFPGENQLAPSPDGLWVAAWGGDGGLRLYQSNGTLLQEVEATDLQAVQWLPDSSGFIYQTGSKLYRLLFPLAQPELIDGDVSSFVVGG